MADKSAMASVVLQIPFTKPKGVPKLKFEEKLTIREMIADGWADDDISEHIHRDKSTVWRYRQELKRNDLNAKEKNPAAYMMRQVEENAAKAIIEDPKKLKKFQEKAEERLMNAWGMSDDAPAGSGAFAQLVPLIKGILTPENVTAALAKLTPPDEKDRMISQLARDKEELMARITEVRDQPKLLPAPKDEPAAEAKAEQPKVEMPPLPDDARFDLGLIHRWLQLPPDKAGAEARIVCSRSADLIDIVNLTPFDFLVLPIDELLSRLNSLAADPRFAWNPLVPRELKQAIPSIMNYLLTDNGRVWFLAFQTAIKTDPEPSEAEPVESE